MPGDNNDEVAARGILYLLIFQQLGQLLRWSWGYNVLLAPAEKITGTHESINSRLENGEVGSEDSEPLLRGASTDDDDDDDDDDGGNDSNQSGSDDTEVDERIAGKGRTNGSHLGQDVQSGQQTPVKHHQRASSFISILSNGGCSKPGPTPDILPTPVNGNNKPLGINGHVFSFPSISSNDNASDEDIPRGFRGAPIRCRIAAKRCIRTLVLYVRAMSQSLLGILKLVLGVLPPRMREGLSTIGLAIRRFFLGFWSFMNPPLWAMLAAIVVASIPDLQRFFFTNGTFFKNSVTSAIRQSGGVAVPLILVVLGGNLARNTLPADPDHTTEDDKEETKLLIAALISRMLLPTIIMAPLLAVTAKFVPVSILDDPIFVIVCFLITGAPSALQLAQICQINNVYMGAMSRLLFQSYVVWILPSTLVLVMCALEVVEWAQR